MQKRTLLRACRRLFAPQPIRLAQRLRLVRLPRGAARPGHRGICRKPLHALAAALDPFSTPSRSRIGH
ncbi:hypothetical protein HNP33_001046 [Comamonas odontotermitis]|uniref:Uncharacterized protein n=1 Tax=Comamonas odontotermitis TaxID=379895 RepID=A0ABR6RCW5_9BURK|nr:hypothetical protein [Comamonas odontotermitis]MBB6576996.1 hypothetical protein [Comamonas odontotermitis]